MLQNEATQRRMQNKREIKTNIVQISAYISGLYKTGSSLLETLKNVPRLQSYETLKGFVCSDVVETANSLCQK